MGSLAPMWDDVTRAPREDHVTAVVSLALAAGPRCGDVVYIALDGPGGAGKTFLARGVELALEPVAPVAVVHMDHLYPGWDGLAQGPGLLTTQVLEPLARGERAAYRIWSWVRDEWVGSREVVPWCLLVVEGGGACVQPAGADAAVSVFVDADVALRRCRGI